MDWKRIPWTLYRNAKEIKRRMQTGMDKQKKENLDALIDEGFKAVDALNARVKQFEDAEQQSNNKNWVRKAKFDAYNDMIPFITETKTKAMSLIALSQERGLTCCESRANGLLNSLNHIERSIRRHIENGFK